jgi:TolA-binding protein
LFELEQEIMENNEKFKDLELQKQLAKEQENHYLHLRSLKRQENAARERIAQHRERVLT